jgi:hypothetical protein
VVDVEELSEAALWPEPPWPEPPWPSRETAVSVEVCGEGFACDL